MQRAICNIHVQQSTLIDGCVGARDGLICFLNSAYVSRRLLQIKVLEEYLSLHEVVPLVGVDIAHRTVELLKTFNTQVGARIFTVNTCATDCDSHGSCVCIWVAWCAPRSREQRSS